VIQDPGNDEEILGQLNEEKQISFIPAFYTKEEGLQCMNLLARQPGCTHEVQAILYEDLARYASGNRFMLVFLNGSGEVVLEINPMAGETDRGA
jgi:hypothetical protein